MIDIENKVFNEVATAIRAEFGASYPNLSIYGEYLDIPSGFPCVTIVEDDNSILTNMQTNSLTEEFARITYSVNIYTNNVVGKKALAKEIADVADLAMQNMKFTRTMRGQTPNIDRTIYRITAQYEGIVGKGVEDASGNITFQMYRR